MKKILHVITGLNDGGAEAVLYRLCLFDKDNQHIVVSLMNEGKYGSLLKNIEIEIYCLNTPRGRIRPFVLWRLFFLIRKINPDTVQTWMYHADLIGGLIARLVGKKIIYWNIRNSKLEKKSSKRSTIIIANICAKVSNYIPCKIICCAEKVREVHVDLGYNEKKMVIICNGYDCANFKYDINAKSNLCDKLNVNKNINLIGMVGRFDPQKDHKNLLRACKNFNEKNIPFHLLLVGKDLTQSNTDIVNWIHHYGLTKNISLEGQCDDIPQIMSAIDLHVLSSSYGEGFPNVVAEAMACETPCIVTDVGDAALIVGDTGWIVPPSDSKALANAIEHALNEKKNNNEKWECRKQAARKRIVENFSIKCMVTAYNDVWNK